MGALPDKLFNISNKPKVRIEESSATNSWMKVIVKYEIKSLDWLEYGMFETMTDMIPNLRIKDRKVPLGGVASNLSWLQKDVYRATDEIKERFPVNEVEYVLLQVPMSQW